MVNYTGDIQNKESEWNEAMFKSKRLHESQELINYFKMNPLGVSDGKFNYSNLLSAIEVLYGEGRSKYTGKEKKEMDALLVLCKKSIKLMPPHIPCRNDSIKGKGISYNFNEKNYNMLMDLLYELEMKTRDYNDDHGLTTRNKQGGGMF